MTTASRRHEDPEPLPAQLEVGLSLAQLLLLDDNKARAAQVLDRVLDLEPHTHDALILRGLLHEDGDQLQGALACFEQATVAHADSAVAHFHLGRTLGAIGRHQDAVAELQAALALQPASVEALQALALVQHAAGRTRLAGEALAQVLLVDPANLDAYATLADLLIARGQQAAAIELLEQARTHVPDAGAIHARLATCHLLLGHWREATAALQQQRAQSPDDENAHLSLALAALGSSDAAMAAQAVDACLERFPHSWRALHLRAMLYDTADRLDLAMRDLRQAVDVEPLAWQALCDLGLFTCALAAPGSVEARDAVELLERAVECCAGASWAPQLNLALALVKIEQRERARALAASIIELGRDDEPAVQQARELLAALTGS